ncbi:unnamed protein product [Candidula unifasciata]|uniref:Complement component 1 Q subcomponent-binding protein, mitochondrial n=1 Tax=Candidula unifasciata TaxID=100452 RepID=A0A8S4A3A7_9EUPU|nr:unnamed protein product [Candidula unifasciata]
MAKALKLAFSIPSKLVSVGSTKALAIQNTAKLCRYFTSSSRTPGTLASSVLTKTPLHTQRCGCVVCRGNSIARYSTEVDSEISKFLEKEIKYETSKSSDKLPKISGFDIQTDGADVTLTKTSGSEKVVVKLSINGAVDSAPTQDPQGKQEENPQIVCRPPFEVEITKGSTVLALQCNFPSPDAVYEEGSQKEGEQIDDQFEIEEVAIHSGEWKDTTYSVSAATMDAELFDLLMDMLDERGINDEFITQLVNFCTVYENKQYINFLQSLKAFAEK